MATTLTSNLKLRITDDLTTDSRYNLNRIDSLGAIYQIDQTQSVRIKSRSTVSIEPNSSDIGGSGSGGQVDIGQASQSLTQLNLYASAIDFNDATVSNLQVSIGDGDDLVFTNGAYTTTLRASQAGQAANVVFNLPIDDGNNGQVLSTDGAGNLSWSTVAGGGGGGSVTQYPWTTGDTDTFTVTHNLGTRGVLVQVMDENFDNITISQVRRDTVNSVELVRQGTPSGDWTVLITS